MLPCPICSFVGQILAREWFGNSTYYDRRDGLWERLQQSVNNLRQPLTVEKIEAIRKFCHVVNVRVHRDSTVMADDSLLLVITDALQAATGSLREPLLLNKRADITDLLRVLYKTMPVTPPTLIPSTAARSTYQGTGSYS